MQVILTFEEVFPEEQRETPESYLQFCTKKDVLTAGALFASINPQKSKYTNFSEVLAMIFGPENNQFANNVYKRVKQIQLGSQKRHFFNPISSLSLIECGLKLDETLDSENDKSQFERALFKAYLALNSDFVATQDMAFRSDKDNEVDDLTIALLFFCTLYPANDKINFNLKEIFVAQIIKATLLFQFLSQNSKANPLLKAFTDYYDSKNWQDYLIKYLPITFSIIKKGDEEKHTIINLDPENENYTTDKQFLKKIAIASEGLPELLDFLNLRSSPIYQLSEDRYLLLFDLFVVEKVFKGLYFFLNKLNSTLPKDQRIEEFRSHYGYEFSEKTLLYKALDPLYRSHKVKLTGNQMDNEGIDGAPDYYIRVGKNILLFESKDFLIRAESKLSYDYPTYEAEFEKKLSYDFDKGKPKAIVQLAEFIRRILQKEFSLDTNYDYRKIRVYPIIITHDIQYDTPGLDVWMNSWFQEELERLAMDGLYINKIKPLTIINIDSLLLHSQVFQDRIPLHKAIDVFLQNRSKRRPFRPFKSKNDQDRFFFTKYEPFSIFIENYLKNSGSYKLPSVKDVIMSSFEGHL